MLKVYLVKPAMHVDDLGLLYRSPRIPTMADLERVQQHTSLAT